MVKIKNENITVTRLEYYPNFSKRYAELAEKADAVGYHYGHYDDHSSFAAGELDRSTQRALVPLYDVEADVAIEYESRNDRDGCCTNDREDLNEEEEYAAYLSWIEEVKRNGDAYVGGGHETQATEEEEETDEDSGDECRSVVGGDPGDVGYEDTYQSRACLSTSGHWCGIYASTSSYECSSFSSTPCYQDESPGTAASPTFDPLPYDPRPGLVAIGTTERVRAYKWRARVLLTTQSYLSISILNIDNKRLKHE